MVGTFLALLLIGSSTTSASTLWDFVIDAKLEKSEIDLHEKPAISGTVLDQASKPIPNAEVTIKFSDQSVVTTTDSKGSFGYEFDEQNTPGTFSVVIFAKLAEKKGFANLSLKIGKQDSTFKEIYYKSSTFGNRTDTLPGTAYDGLQLKQYQKYLEDQNRRMQKQIGIEAQNTALNEVHERAKQILNDDINSRVIGPGVFSNKDTQRYLTTINPAVRDSISMQMNYTKQVYEEARAAMKQILDEGGSLEDAKKAYFDKLAITKDQLNEINGKNNTDNHSKIKTSNDKKINSKKVKGLSVNKNLK
ncbi:MAG TPA: carboxypeptidase-like regulatory domain-containing protein [Candidatus Nitrosotenuis sp.]|nr:carboxypeptidase-like regulatory domain-containing protein [Candidatus Nitrosotenuis sp.]